MMNPHRTDRDWERLARLDPYHAVLTDSQYEAGANVDGFFRSGEAHIAHVFENCPMRPKLALDFGCGVGRLLVPLSNRCEHLIGMDVSPTMLEAARKNLSERGIDNFTLCESDDSLSAVPEGIDFIHSMLVFPHIPVKRGERIFAALLSKLSPGGRGAIQFPFWSSASAWRKMAARLTKVQPFSGLLNLARGKPFLHPRMQVNLYSLDRLFRILHQHSCSSVRSEIVALNEVNLDVMLYFEKTTS